MMAKGTTCTSWRRTPMCGRDRRRNCNAGASRDELSDQAGSHGSASRFCARKGPCDAKVTSRCRQSLAGTCLPPELRVGQNEWANINAHLGSKRGSVTKRYCPHVSRPTGQRHSRVPDYVAQKLGTRTTRVFMLSAETPSKRFQRRGARDTTEVGGKTREAVPDALGITAQMAITLQSRCGILNNLPPAAKSLVDGRARGWG